MINNQQSYSAVSNPTSRKVFRSIFKARWQNLQNLINDSAYLSLLPPHYATYYQAYTKQCIEWAQGFVPQLHKQDFFSTGMGYTVCDIFVKECMAGGYRIQSANKELQKTLEKWAKDVNLTEDLSVMFWQTNSGGNSILVATPVNDEIYITAYPKDRCFIEIGRKNIATKAILLNRFVSGSENCFYARETRILVDKQAYYKIELFTCGTINSPMWTNSPFYEIPKSIKDQWQNCYGDIEINQWYKLPSCFDGIGCWNIKNKAVSASLADMPYYSDSTLQTALDVLYAIDYNYTQGQVDQYIGKSVELIPKQLPNPREAVVGQDFRTAINSSSQLDDQFFTQVDTGTIDGKPIQPTFIQPELRGQERKIISDYLLELLASKVGLSSSSLANHLTNNNDKTATEVNVEKDTTAESVENKRKLATEPINEMLKLVARFYGYEDDVDITWGRTGGNNISQNQALLAEFNAKTLTLRQYLKKRWVDLTDEEIERMATEIEAENQAKIQKEREQSFSDFGDLLNGDGNATE